MRLRLSASLLVLSACQSNVVPLGEHPLDVVALDDAAPLRHLTGPSDAATVDDLFSKKLSWSGQVDASNWFETTHTAHQALPAMEDGVDLKILTYNVGLLDRNSIVGRTFVPHGEQRLPRQVEVLFDDGWDVILLQEVWEWEAHETLARAAEDAGYLAWGGSEKRHAQHGVSMFIRGDLVAETLDTWERQYDSQRDLEKWPGPNIKRGYLGWRFELAGTDREVAIIDTHMSAFYNFQQVRNDQARELGLTVQDEAEGDTVVIVGGDLNAGYVYPRDEWLDAEGNTYTGWLENGVSTPLLAWYGELQDARNAHSLSREAEAAASVPFPADPSWLDTPYGDSGFCDTLDPELTGTDCNSLYHANYASEEPPAKLDHILFRDDLQRVRVTDAGLAYTDVLEFPDGTYELSDHYGVHATLRIGATE